MDPAALFGIIHGSYCTISTNIYFYLQYFQQKVFSSSKISGSQTNPYITTKILLSVQFSTVCLLLTPNLQPHPSCILMKGENPFELDLIGNFFIVK